MQKTISYFFVSAAFALFLLLSGCDIKGASDPFSYVPVSPHSIWVPPPKAQKRLPQGEVNPEIEDYQKFSEENPLTLAEAIDISLYYNPATKQSWANARVSAAEYAQSLQNEFILADLAGNYSRTRSADVSVSDSIILYQTQYGAELQLSYLIFDFGQTRTTSQAALQSLYNADWSHNSQIQTTIQTIMNDYYAFLLQKKLLVAKEQDVLNAKVTLDATEERFKRGLADISDVMQAKTSYLQQKLDLVSQKQSLYNSYTELLSNMGVPANLSIHFQDYPEEIQKFKIESLDELIIQANSNRPDLLSAEANVKSNEYSYKAAQLKKFPVISGSFDIGRQYFQRGITDHYDFAASLALTFPLFQGYFIESSIKQAKANLEVVKAELEEVRLSIIQQVANYRSDVIFAGESIQYATSYLESAEEDYKVSLERYKVGTGTIVDLINAQTAVANARAKLAEAQNSWYTSLANLAYSTGILLPPKHNQIGTPL